jgi:hypothetical protein
MSNRVGHKCNHVRLWSIRCGLRWLVHPSLEPSAPLVVLVIIDPYHFGFTSDFKSFRHPFCWAVVIKADPTLKLVSDCKFSPIEGAIPTWELRKWSRLPSCHWNQEVVPLTVPCFLGPLLLRNLGTRFLLGGRVITPLVLLQQLQYIYSTSMVLLQWWLQ